jgi:hypothetical protein
MKKEQGLGYFCGTGHFLNLNKLKNLTGAAFLAVRISYFLKITLTDRNFLTLWWVIEDGSKFSDLLLM